MHKVLQKAKEMQDIIVKHRRYLHTIPEIGLELPQTRAYVIKQLKEMGYEPVELGKGVVATVGRGKTGKTFMIRGDMDALEMKEESGLEFESNNGLCHACGHDTHTAMLLGAAQLLKDMEDEIEGTIKFMFQAGEETLDGALSMVEAGVLWLPSPPPHPGQYPPRRMGHKLQLSPQSEKDKFFLIKSFILPPLNV